MSEHDMWAMDCPHCQQEIKKPVAWFKEDKVVCPSCEKELSAAEVAKVMAKIKEKFINPDEEIEFNF